MSVSEREDAQLFELLSSSVGRETAMKVIDRLPPADEALATAAQVEHLEQRMGDRFAVVDQRFAAVEQRMDDRFAVVDQRFDALEDRIDDRIDGLRTELLAAFRGELVTAVSGQTRHIIVATATAVFGIGGLAVTLAQVLG